MEPVSEDRHDVSISEILIPSGVVISTPSISPPPVDNQKGRKKQLSAGMEHMRYAVTIPEQDPDVYGMPGYIQPIRKPRTDSSQNPQKRTDPFQFGSRYLEEGDDIFAYNAWDHVETDEDYRTFAEEQYQRQRDAPVTDVDKSTYVFAIFFVKFVSLLG
jgi:tRNAThr (cytosine32-N3)-methyltransferase